MKVVPFKSITVLFLFFAALVTGCSDPQKDAQTLAPVPTAASESSPSAYEIPVAPTATPTPEPTQSHSVPAEVFDIGDDWKQEPDAKSLMVREIMEELRDYGGLFSKNHCPEGDLMAEGCMEQFQDYIYDVECLDPTYNDLTQKVDVAREVFINVYNTPSPLFCSAEQYEKNVQILTMR